MTDELDKLAREIVKTQHLGVGKVALVRLGLEAGEERCMKLQRERDAAIAETIADGFIEPVQSDYDRRDGALSVAQAIRTLT